MHTSSTLRVTLSLLLLTFAFALLPSIARAAPRCFPEAPDVAACIDGRIRSFWEDQGGLPVFGYPLGPQHEENGQQVQIFERARLELHPENAAPYDVLLGRLGADRLAQQGRDPANFPSGQQGAGCLFFAQTGHSLCPPLLQTWRRYGLDLGDPGMSERESLALFGLPLSEPQPEEVAPGVTLTVQWFERARFENHGADGVLLGLLGRELDGASSASAPAAPNPQAPAAAGFVQASGDKLTVNGQPIQLKGVNYYPQGEPWVDMWEYWRGPQTERELRTARDDLGINAVRVLVPYDLGTWHNRGDINPRQLNRLSEFVQIAGNLNIKVIVSLFDFEQDFPAAGSQLEAEQRAFLNALVGPFVGDDRVMAWDIHNEPDNYDLWKTPAGADQVQLWLGRMADLLHALDHNHLVTVGVANYSTLWRVGLDGRSILDYSDLVSFHTYNAADTARQIDDIRAHTTKPILLGEFGWPTGPTCSQSGYDEATQATTYRQAIDAASGRVAGMMQWTLRDYDPGPSFRYDTREEHYGLYRPDNSLKPAAAVFRSYSVPPLPSTTRSDLPLTAEGPNPLDGPLAPKLMPSDKSGQSYYVKQYFRRAWNLLGGQGSFGVPVSEAFVRPEDGRVVQYFSAGALAYYPEATKTPGFYQYDEIGQVQLLIRPLAIGRTMTVNRSFPPVDRPPEREAQFFPATGHTLRGDFLSFYRGTFSNWRFGAPISEELTEQINGVDTRVQYFENARLEWDAAASNVRVGALGREAWDRQCRSVGQ